MAEPAAEPAAAKIIDFELAKNKLSEGLNTRVEELKQNAKFHRDKIADEAAKLKKGVTENFTGTVNRLKSKFGAPAAAPAAGGRRTRRRKSSRKSKGKRKTSKRKSNKRRSTKRKSKRVRFSLRRR